MTTTTLSDGRIFPVYNGEVLSWSLGLYSSTNEQNLGYPRARAVIRAMKAHRPDQLERERIEMLKGSFDRIFGQNAKRMLNLIEAEISSSAETNPPSPAPPTIPA